MLADAALGIVIMALPPPGGVAVNERNIEPHAPLVLSVAIKVEVYTPPLKRF